MYDADHRMHSALRALPKEVFVQSALYAFFKQNCFPLDLLRRLTNSSKLFPTMIAALSCFGLEFPALEQRSVYILAGCFRRYDL